MNLQFTPGGCALRYIPGLLPEAGFLRQINAMALINSCRIEVKLSVKLVA